MFMLPAFHLNLHLTQVLIQMRRGPEEEDHHIEEEEEEPSGESEQRESTEVEVIAMEAHMSSGLVDTMVTVLMGITIIHLTGTQQKSSLQSLSQAFSSSALSPQSLRAASA